MADALEDCHATRVELSRATGAKPFQENAQEPTSIADGYRPFILHDNARPHIADVVTKNFNYGWEVLPQPPYSPDMSPLDFDLFPKLKEPMRG